MPELPDVAVYVEALNAHVGGRRLDRLLLVSPFVLRSVDPPIGSVNGRTVRQVSRIGKRIVFAFDDPTLFLVVHLIDQRDEDING